MRQLFIGLLLLALAACQRHHFVLSTKPDYNSIDSSKTEKNAVRDSIAIYKQKVDAEMNTTIGIAAQPLTKQQPESLLGNFVADAVHHQAELYTGAKADLTVLNQGGLRIDALPQGPLTRGKIFELLPFDNMVVVLDMDGAALRQLMNHIAAKDGWPASQHLRLQFKNGQVASATLDGQEIQDAKRYRVVTNDYLANGGDNCTFFANQPRTETGKFIRDAVIEYIQTKTAKNQSVDAQIEGRVRRLD